MTPKEYKEQLIGQFAEFNSVHNGNAHIKELLATLENLDFPTKRHEEWKYTSLDRVIKKSPKLPIKSSEIDQFWLAEKRIPGIENTRIILINGKLDRFDALPNGMSIEAHSLGNKVEANPTDSSDIFENLNSAFSIDNLKITVDANAIISETISIVNILDAEIDSVFAQRNIEIEV